MASSKNFDDAFHAHGDDDDVHLDETVDFDELFTEWESKGEVKVMHNDDPAAPPPTKRPSSSEPTTDTGLKKVKTQTDVTDGRIPSYLHEQFHFFDQVMHRFTERPSSPIDVDDLREIAILVHELNFTKLSISQWQTYLLSGKGELQSGATLSIWPPDVMKAMVRDKVVTVSDESQIDSAACLAYTESYLHQLRDRVTKLQAELDEQKRRLKGFTPRINQTIEEYVFQQYMNEAELQIRQKIVVVEFDYRDRLYEVEFEHLRPDEQQSQVYRELYQAHCDYEKSKTNVDILKQQIFYKEFPDSFDSFRLPIPLEVESISDPTTRQTLHNQYQRIVQQTKSEMMLIHVAVAEAKLRQHHDRLKTMQNDPAHEQRFTSAMKKVMQRRCENYEERMSRLYSLKINFFVNAPTVIQYS